MWLLRDQIGIDAELGQAVKEKWLGVLLEFHLHGSSQAQELVRLATILDPKRCRDFLSREMDDEARQRGRLTTALSIFRCAWDHSLSSIVTDFIDKRNLPGEALRDALFHLAGSDGDFAKAWLAQRTSRFDVSSAEALEASGAYAAVAIGYFSTDFWDTVWPQIEADDGLARRTLMDLVYATTHRGCRALGIWTERELSQIYLRLEQVYPSANDPDFRSGKVTDAGYTQDFRRYLSGTLEKRASEAACDELLWLAKKLPSEGTWMRWRRKNALTRCCEMNGAEQNRVFCQSWREIMKHVGSQIRRTCSS